MKNNYLTKSIGLISIGVFSLSSAITLTSCDNYYSGISSSLSGEALQEALREKITHTDQYSYSSLATIYKTSDADLTTIDEATGEPTNVILFYTGESYYWGTGVSWGQMGTSSNSVNREHVWPQSRFNYSEASPGPYSDAHIVRPAKYSVNVDRSNYFFYEGGNFDPATYEGADESYRGDVARILLYAATRYDYLELIDEYEVSTSSNPYAMGKLSDILKWNLEYPVLDREVQRNEAIYESRQGNRNPFIDNPDYACRIYGETNDSTREICSTQS